MINDKRLVINKSISIPLILGGGVPEGRGGR